MLTIFCAYSSTWSPSRSASHTPAAPRRRRARGRSRSARCCRRAGRRSPRGPPRCRSASPASSCTSGTGIGQSCRPMTTVIVPSALGSSLAPWLASTLSSSIHCRAWAGSPPIRSRAVLRPEHVGQCVPVPGLKCGGERGQRRVGRGEIRLRGQRRQRGKDRGHGERLPGGGCARACRWLLLLMSPQAASMASPPPPPCRRPCGRHPCPGSCLPRLASRLVLAPLLTPPIGRLATTLARRRTLAAASTLRRLGLAALLDPGLGLAGRPALAGPLSLARPVDARRDRPVRRLRLVPWPAGRLRLPTLRPLRRCGRLCAAGRRRPASPGAASPLAPGSLTSRAGPLGRGLPVAGPARAWRRPAPPRAAART